MEIKKIKNRNFVYSYSMSEWNLNLHVILGSRNNFIIDTGLGSSNIEPISELLKTNSNPNIVINTHYHWDHIWGNYIFHDCPIISHRLCRELLQTEWDAMMEKNKSYVRGNVEKCLPNLVFEDSLYFPDDGIRIIYTPGHTIDCISVLDEQEHILNAGDNIGDTIEDIVPFVECEKEVYISTLLKYQNMDFDTCISGHNTVLGKDVIDRILSEYV